MSGLEFMEKINTLDPELIMEAEKEGLIMEKEKKNARIKWISAAAAVVLIAAGAILGAKGFFAKKPVEDPVNEAGGFNGKVDIHSEIVVSGAENAFSDEEGHAFMLERLEGFANDLKANGVPVTSLTVPDHGYSHVRTGANGNEVYADWRDYLLYDGEEIKGIVTVHKENGTLYGYIAFGSPWFPEYAAYLKAHSGEELVYVWFGDVDVILSPDGELFSAFSEGFSEVVDETEKPLYYEFFKTAYNTYTP